MLVILRGFLTHSNAVVKLGCHIQSLVGGSVAFAHERAVVGGNHRDVGVIARAELGIVVAGASINDWRLSRGRRRCCVHGPIAEGRRASAANQDCQGIGCGGHNGLVS